jgi:hypothetical protein
MDQFRERSVVSGACSAGFKTAVLPQASAGASLVAAIDSGAFQALIRAHTPIGSRSM